MEKKKITDAEDLRASLQTLIFKEMENLSETLAGLEPMQRLNIICKLIPYAIPKAEAEDSKLFPFGR